MNIQLEVAISTECKRLFEAYPAKFPNGMPEVRFYSRRPTGRKEIRRASADWRFNRVQFNIHPLVMGTDTVAEALDTARHEMAHIATPWQHHNANWKFVAKMFGATATRTKQPVVRFETVMQPAPIDPLLALFSRPRPIVQPGE